MAAPPPPAMTTPVPMPAVPAVEQQPMAVAAQPQVAMMPAAAQPQVAMMQAPAPVMPMAMVPQPTWAASVAHVEKLPDGQMRQRMTIGSGGVDACCRLMEAGKVDRSLFSTGEIIKVGLALPANAFTDGGAKRDAVVKSNSARTRLRNVEGGHKFRVLGLSTVNETERPVACAYLCSTLLLSLNVKPDNCAESFSTATRLARNTQDKRVGGQPLQSASARRPLDELSPEVVKEHLVRNPHLMTQALNDPRCHGARTVVIQSQLLKARPQLESLTGVLGFVVPRDALDRLVLPAMKEVGRVLGGVLIANVPRYATTWREDQQVVPPAIVSGATFNQPEGGADGMGEDGAPGTPGNPGAVRHRGPALSSGQKKEILKTIVAHPDRLPTSRSLVRPPPSPERWWDRPEAGRCQLLSGLPELLLPLEDGIATVRHVTRCPPKPEKTASG
ncbi:hypothetical protein T484DRAFT_3480435 [Baffinella frigidus]|nr:hypothetical protein T484DRAFT_3480435 [Cryptophyta sp. CCMP2293]